MTQPIEKQILVAGVGNAWLRDDGFGGEVAKRLRGPRAALRRDASWTSAPAASTSPTRSCAATTRWSWSTSAARAASPGTLYVMEPDEADIAAGDRGRRDASTRTAWTRRPCCASSAVGGWPGKVVVDRLRARRGRGDRARAHATRSRRRSTRAVDARVETIEELRDGRADARALAQRASSTPSSATPAGRRVTAVHLRVGHLRQVVPDVAGVLLRASSRATRVCEGARLEQELVPARLRCRLRARVGDRRARLPLPGVRRGRRDGRQRRGARGRVDRGRGGGAACTA